MSICHAFLNDRETDREANRQTDRQTDRVKINEFMCLGLLVSSVNVVIQIRSANCSGSDIEVESCKLCNQPV